MKRLKDLPEEEQVKLVMAHHRGEKMEFLMNTGSWGAKTDGPLGPLTTYRLAVTKPSIDWSHVHEDYNWLSVEASGRAYLYKFEPVCIDGNRMWDPRGDCFEMARPFASYDPGTCDWKDSLIQRPKD